MSEPWWQNRTPEDILADQRCCSRTPEQVQGNIEAIERCGRRLFELTQFLGEGRGPLVKAKPVTTGSSAEPVAESVRRLIQSGQRFSSGQPTML